MPEPTIAVPADTLRKILRLAREGAAPRIHWSLSREQMDRSAMQIRGEYLQDIADEVEPLLPPDAQ